MRFENCMKTPVKNDLKTKESQVGKPNDLGIWTKMFNRSILFYHLPWEVVNVTVQSGGKQAHAHILTVDLGQGDRYHYLVLLKPAT